MRPVIIIPARYAATRLPGKPLADIHGRAMIVHVWERAVASRVGPVWVATDDARIREAVERAGGQAVMTAPALPSGSDRVWAAFREIAGGGDHFDVVINLQGDLPAIEPEAIRAVLAPLENPEVDIATLACEIADEEEKNTPAVVKSAISWEPGGKQGRALYFSRNAIPHGEGALYHHIGIYAFRPGALERFVALPPSALELRERLEQLRALEAGMRIDVAKVGVAPLGIDTPEQLEQVRKTLAARGF